MTDQYHDIWFTRRRRIFASVLSSLLMALLAVGRAEIAMADASEQTVHVADTHNGQPFDYRMHVLREETAATVYGLTYPSPITTEHKPNNTVWAEYYLPKNLPAGARPRPAVVCLHILNGDFQLVRILCASLASRGIPAIMFKLPYYGERALPGGLGDLEKRPELFFALVPQAVADVRRTVDVLAARPEVDANRIGIAGISLGGLISARAAADEPRVGRIVLILAGGDLKDIIANARETRKLREQIQAQPEALQAKIETALREADPLTYAAKLRQRAAAGNILMINATEDQTIPPRCTRKLATAMGMEDRVRWLEGLGHYTAIVELPGIIEQTVAFFADDVPPPAVQEDTSTDRTPRDRLVGLIGQVHKLASTEPGAGRCHLIDLEVHVSRDGKPIAAGRVMFTRGASGRFQLKVAAEQPEKITVALGQDKTPWLAAVDKGVVFRGERQTLPVVSATENIDERHQAKLRMALGILSAAAVTPGLLESVLEMRDLPTEDGHPAIELRLKRQPKDRVVLMFDAAGKKPVRMSGVIDGADVDVRFHAWQFEAPAPDALFAPDGQLRRVAVQQADMQRMFSALVTFIMEKVE